ncbi:UPF0280 family protein [Methanoplanus endosymbiosus]|uniref:UPF0280 protein L6E24_01850 n=1 Tax=Methanoplanus endosymbiosus TaxID=33865 RepID=A0A9E7PMG3_9EURY|nr:UPF0280 family protein [Methanoplanus endosymbiosus]UUX92898.1 UPF0280 family protein [Methanoplanus endosymbiosus]
MMIRKHFQYKSTITTIISDRQEYIEAAEEAMVAARQEIESIIVREPLFLPAIAPLKISSDSGIIMKMADAAFSAGTGPMASVAGTIAWEGVTAMKKAGAECAVIDNGGDIAILSDRQMKIGLFCGNAEISGKIAFLMPPKREICGICTSSATVGPSISFGIADSVTVFSENVSLADAWATALCNILTPENADYELENIAEKDIDGVFVVIGDEIFSWGSVPEVVSAEFDDSLITSG